ISSTAAGVAGNCLANVFIPRLLVVRQQLVSRQHQSRRAVAALQGVAIAKNLLDGAELAIFLQALDGGDLGAVGLYREDCAGLHAGAVQQHGAGATVSRVASVEPRILLVELLREALDLTGTHVGCDTTYCGACTVLLNGASVKSCTIFAVQADGAEITTVEGLEKDGQLGSIQKVFGDCYALQCGYCTPGLMLSTYQ